MEIKIKNLTKIFPGDVKKRIRDTIAVKDLDFVVPDAHFLSPALAAQRHRPRISRRRGSAAPGRCTGLSA